MWVDLNHSGRYYLILDTVQSDSVFRVLEPVIGKMYGRASDQAHSPIEPRIGLGNTQSDCFRVYRVGPHYFSSYHHGADPC